MKFLLFSLYCLWLLSPIKSECRYRNLDLPKELFSYWASWGCYFYTRPDFFIDAPMELYTCSLYIKDTTYYFPGIKEDIFCQPFHPKSDFVVSKVNESFWSDRSVKRWIECTKEAENCCNDVMISDTVIDERCPSVWDGWSCFRSIPAGKNYRALCSRFAYGLQPPRCQHFSYKKCFDNGTWNHQTDYSPCDITPPLKARNNYYITILSISIIFCTPALLVLFFTKAAQSQKLRIIRALLFVICIHNISIILVRALIIMPELTAVRPTTTVMYKNTTFCRSLTLIEKFLGNVVFCCMLLIGIFLHRLLSNLLRIHDRKNGAVMIQFYIAAAIMAVGSVAAWTVMMSMYYDNNCWQVSNEGYVDWILDGPRLGMLIVNLILLLNITIRLWHAFNAKESDTNPFLRALKAALICLPVFGMQFLFLIIRPDMDNCGTEQFYYITNFTIVGAQGIFIAIFHCYMEREVSKYFAEYWWKFKGLFQKNQPAHRWSTGTANETRLELIENITISQRVPQPQTSRPRSSSCSRRNESQPNKV